MLLTTGAALLAQRGIDGVSLREITRAAGQRNSTALQYHFGDRDGLLRAILDRHGRDVAARRHTLLDRLQTVERPGARDIAEALCLPLVTKLRDEGGPDYLQIAAQLVNQVHRQVADDEPFSMLIDDSERSIRRWSALTEPLIPAAAVGPPLHRRFAALRFTHTELGRRARDITSEPDDSLFTTYLVDLVHAIIVAPVSETTQRLLDASRAAQPPAV